MNDQKEKIEKAGTFFRFEDLRVYHKSLDYINWLQDVTMLFPNNSSDFVNQYNVSARNIAFFIAEGSARNHKNEFKQFLYISLSSCSELNTQLTIAQNLDYIDSVACNTLLNELEIISKMLQGLIKSINK